MQATAALGRLWPCFTADSSSWSMLGLSWAASAELVLACNKMHCPAHQPSVKVLAGCCMASSCDKCGSCAVLTWKGPGPGCHSLNV